MLTGKRYIICRNSEGIEILIGEKETNPFALLSAEGLYTINNRVATTENTMMDGATYHGSTAKMRNIILTIANKPPYPGNRELLDAVFKEADAGTLIFHEDGGTEKTIDYYVESVESDGEPNSFKHVISLLCPDPFFYAPNDVIVLLANWEGLFEFEHEFVAAGEEFGRQSNIRMAEIINTNMVDRVGMTIRVLSYGPVTNPSIAIAETGEEIQVGSSAKPFNMVSGDVLEITTETGNKHVYFTHNGTTQEINHYLTDNSVFLQLRRGSNHIGYEADSGAKYMSVEIIYRLKFARA